MMQAAETWHRYDFATWAGIFFCLTTGRCFLRQREMSPVTVVADVLVHQAFRMAFIENDHMFEQIAAAVAHSALGNTVLPQTAEAGLLGLDAKHLHRIDHFFIELRAAIKDQIAGCHVVRECFAQLLNDPGACRMFGHIAVEDAPTVMRNDKEAVE